MLASTVIKFKINFFLLLLLLIVVFSLFGYYDENWKIVPREKQEFYNSLGLESLEKSQKLVQCVSVSNNHNACDYIKKDCDLKFMVCKYSLYSACIFKTSNLFCESSMCLFSAGSWSPGVG